VARSPVSYSGEAGDMGKRRRFAIVGIGDQKDFPEYTTYTNAIVTGMRRCGADIVVDDGRSTQHCFSDGGAPCPQDALQEMARFQQAGATTIVMTENNDTGFEDGADRLRWQPEFLLLSDGYGENSGRAKDGNRSAPNAWKHMRSVTTNVLSPPDPADRPCFRAAKSADPTAPDQDLRLWWCIVYPTLRTVFIGLQVAGPKLTPEAMDRGFHAIPPTRSTDPMTPACYFDPGDYTCVKDVALTWFDPGGRTPGDAGNDGCWRMTGGGARYLRGTWPEREIDDRKRDDDPCTLIGPPNVTG
jgi:hypothetical protein